MFDQMFESFRRASETSLQMQQEMFKQWSQPWFAAPPNPVGASAEWGGTFQKRWFELAIEILNKQRESLDATYRAGIQVLEKTLRVSEVKSAEDYRHAVEDVLKKMYENFKSQAETQLREFQKLAEKSFEIVQKA